MTVTRVLVFMLAVVLGFVGLIINTSLPLWCDTPDFGINYLAQPFCK